MLYQLPLLLLASFWILWCMGKVAEADAPTVRLDATRSGLCFPTSTKVNDKVSVKNKVSGSRSKWRSRTRLRSRRPDQSVGWMQTRTRNQSGIRTGTESESDSESGLRSRSSLEVKIEVGLRIQSGSSLS